MEVARRYHISLITGLVLLLAVMTYAFANLSTYKATGLAAEGRDLAKPQVSFRPSSNGIAQINFSGGTANLKSAQSAGSATSLLTAL